MKPALPIRKRLSALTCIKAGPKAVLIEVCELHENGGRGCFASNGALSKKLGVSVATVTRTVASLTSWGLLATRIVPAEANRRYLCPTAAVRACYAAANEAQQLAAVAELTIVKSSPETELTIVENETDYSQNGELTIVKNGVDYSQNASRVIGEDQKKTILEAQLQSLREGLAEAEDELTAAQKKIVELEAENARLRALGAAGTMTSHQGGRWGYDPAEIHPALVLPFDTPDFREAWIAYRTFREQQKHPQFTGGMQEQAALQHLGNLAGGSEAEALEIIKYNIRGGWKDLYKPDAKRTSTQQSAPGQSGGGQKPTLNAVAMAGTLASRRFQQPGGSAGDTGQTTGTHPGQGTGGTPGFDAH